MTHPAFCTHCGAALALQDHGHPRCSGCGTVAYADPKLAAAAIIPMDNGIVLVRRAIEPAYGRWSFPSGYVDRGEKVEKAVEREVWEESGLEVSARWLVGLYSEEGRPVVLSVYHAEITGGTLVAGDESSDAGTFSLDRLPEMAFDHDDRIIADWLEGRRLRGC